MSEMYPRYNSEDESVFTPADMLRAEVGHLALRYGLPYGGEGWLHYKYSAEDEGGMYEPVHKEKEVLVRLIPNNLNNTVIRITTKELYEYSGDTHWFVGKSRQDRENARQ